MTIRDTGERPHIWPYIFIRMTSSPRGSVLGLKLVPKEALCRSDNIWAHHKLQERQTDTAEKEFSPVEMREWRGLRSNDGNTYFQICSQ